MIDDSIYKENHEFDINARELYFRELYDLYWNRIFSTALTFTRSYHIAMEVVQDTFVRVWKNTDKIAQLENPEAFIIVIAKNRIKTQLKQQKNKGTFGALHESLEDKTPSPEQVASIRQFQQLIHQVADLLPPQQALVFKLSRFDQLTYEEIAVRLNISTATVRNHLIKALNVLRIHFAKRSKDLLLFIIALTNF